MTYLKAKKYVPYCLIPLALILQTTQTHPQKPSEETKQIRVKGIVTASREINIAVDIIAHVKTIPFKEGNSFEKNDPLVEFDCTRYQAELDIAKAEYEAQNIIFQNNDELFKKGAIGANERQLSALEITKANAKKNALNAKIKQCIFNAPFAGKIAQIFIEEHELSYANEPLMRIIDHNNLDIELIIPSQWITKIKPKQQFTFRVDETQKKYQAEIRDIAAEVDPISQTIQIKAVFTQQNPETIAGNISPGMSGEAILNAK